jgi:hypothetical protein
MEIFRNDRRYWEKNESVVCNVKNIKLRIILESSEDGGYTVYGLFHGRSHRVISEWALRINALAGSL